MGKVTRVTQTMDSAGIPYALHSYSHGASAERVGLQTARSLGVEPEVLLKTLTTRVGGKSVDVVIRSDREVVMKKLAAALGARTAGMLDVAEAERASIFKVGGISPFGQRRRVPFVVDQDALRHCRVFVNGGQRSLQVGLDPIHVMAFLDAIVADLG